MIRRGRSGKLKRHNAVLSRHMGAIKDTERAALQVKRAAAQKAKQLKIKLTVAAVARKRKLEATRAEEAAKQAKLDALPKNFTAENTGNLGKAGLAARVGCLERLHVRSPPLPFAEEASWVKVRDAYALHLPREFPHGLGAEFIKMVNELLQALGTHYKSPTKFNTKVGVYGNPEAFRTFFKKMDRKIPKPVTVAVM